MAIVINSAHTLKNLFSVTWTSPLLYRSLTFKDVTILLSLSLYSSPFPLFLATYQKKSDVSLLNYEPRVLVCWVPSYLSPLALPLQVITMFSLKILPFHFLKTTMPLKNNLFLSKRDQNIVTKISAITEFFSSCLLLLILHLLSPNPRPPPFQQFYQICSDVVVLLQESQSLICSLAENLANCRATIQPDFYDNCYLLSSKII